MSDLKTTVVVVRGASYKVREMTGKEMSGVRRLVASETDKFRVEAYVASICAVEPKFANEAAAADAPQLVIDQISAAAFRLTRGEDDPTTP